MNLSNITIYTFLILSAFAVVFPIPALAANSSIFTLEAWVKPTTSIATKSVVAKAEEIRLVTDASGNPVCQIKSSSTWQTAATSSAAISVDTWSHIACSYDKVNLKVFVNGVEKGSTNLTVAVDDTAAALKLGTDDSADDVYGEFEGKIDDVRFYNYARSVKQIVSDMLARQSWSGATAGGSAGHPVAYWKFDEGYGDTANDSSPHDNDGDLAGSCPGAGTCPSWTNSGKFGKALSFDGDDYVDLGSHTSNFISGAGSASFWFKGTADSAESIWSVSKDTVDWFAIVLGNDAMSVLTNELITISIDGSGNRIGYATTNRNELFDGNWHHIVVLSNSSSYGIYLDGMSKPISVGQGSNNGDWTDTPTSPSYTDIGAIRRSDGNYYFCDGTIDEVKIYNYALTEDEIRVEYNQGKAIVLGATGTELDGKTPSFSANREYCVPGDTTSCDPPVAEWNFNENTGSSAFDTSANNNTGTWNGTGSHWTPLGRYGSAGSFNGSNDYVNCGADTSLNITDAITLEAWIKPSVWGSDGTIIRKSNAYLIDINTGTQFRFWLGNVGARTYSVSEYSLDEWIHLVGVYSGSRIAFYINGNEKSAANASGNITINGSNLLIGAETSTGDLFNGAIDHVKIYDYARTPAQVAWSYNRGKPVAHWSFDECQGTVAHDESGNSNTGTITIGATVPQTVLGTCETPTNGTGAWYNGRTGKINSAMSFDGADDYVDCGNMSFTSDISVGAWVKTSTAASMGIVASGNVTNRCNLYMHWTGVIQFSNFSTGAGNGVQTTNTYNDGNWHHIVGTRESSTWKIYVDGVRADTGDASSSLSWSGNETVIGCIYSTHRHFNGIIDDVRIYNYVLTPLQIQMDYNNSSAAHFK